MDQRVMDPSEHFPREPLARRIKMMAATPGATICVHDSILTVTAEDEESMDRCARRLHLAAQIVGASLRIYPHAHVVTVARVSR